MPPISSSPPSFSCLSPSRYLKILATKQQSRPLACHQPVWLDSVYSALSLYFLTLSRLSPLSIRLGVCLPLRRRKDPGKNANQPKKVPGTFSTKVLPPFLRCLSCKTRHRCTSTVLTNLLQTPLFHARHLFQFQLARPFSCNTQQPVSRSLLLFCSASRNARPRYIHLTFLEIGHFAKFPGTKRPPTHP